MEGMLQELAKERAARMAAEARVALLNNEIDRLKQQHDSEKTIERKTIEEQIEALKKSEEKYRSIIENMNLGMLELDASEQVIYANQRFSTMSGYEAEELLEKKVTDFFLQGESVKKVSDQTTKRKYFVNNSSEVAVKTKKGDTRWWLISATPLLNADGSLKGSIGVHLDITRQKRLEQQLREAKLEAERSAQSKDTFLANMSHEIRTPINAIMGLGQLLSKSDMDTQQRYYLSSIRSATESLLVIINDVLDFSKIDAGKITLERLGFNLANISNHVIDMLRHKAEEKGLTFLFEPDANIAPVLIGDPHRLNQVLMNMLSNAIKFTEKGSILLKTNLLEDDIAGQKIKITISDTGIGMNKDFLNHLFDKFTQEDETVARRFGGTGLGMSISKQLVGLMGGTLTVDSIKNEGTTISIYFNFKKGTDADLEKKEELISNLNILNGKRILLVEDNEMNRLVAYAVLKQYGANVSEVEDGRKAIAKMKDSSYDLVLMDIQMPELDGYETTRIIRSEISDSIPIIALTANAIIGEKEKCLVAGMDDFISKPYDEGKMVHLIAKWLNKFYDQPISQEVATTTAPLYDLKKIQSISAGNSDFVKQMLGIFINDVPIAIARIKDAYENNDFGSLRYILHRTKPSISNMGITHLKNDIAQIEQLAGKGEKNTILKILIDNLDDVVKSVVAQLKENHYN